MDGDALHSVAEIWLPAFSTSRPLLTATVTKFDTNTTALLFRSGFLGVTICCRYLVQKNAFVTRFGGGAAALPMALQVVPGAADKTRWSFESFTH